MALGKDRRGFLKYLFCFTAIAGFPFFLGKHKRQDASAAPSTHNKSNYSISSEEDIFILDGWIVHVDQIKTRLSGEI